MPTDTPTAFPGPRTRRMRWIALTLLVTAGVVNYLDRSALSIGNAPIRAALHLSDTQMGLLLSAFAVAYGAAQIPAGLLIDRFGARPVTGAGLAIWSVAQLAASAVGGFGQFVAARIALGLGESPMYLSGTKVCADWFESRARALPIGVFNASASLGPAIAPVILTPLLVSLGWRWMFASVGIAGLLVALAWLGFYRDPTQYGITPAERAWLAAEDGETADATAGSWSTVFRERNAWVMAAGFFGVIYLFWLYGTWLPDYLHRARHLSVARSGFWSAVPQGCGFLGAMLGGWIARLLARRGLSPLGACNLPLVLAMLATALFTATTPLVSGTASAIALVSLALFSVSLASSCGWAMAAVATKPSRVATLEALQNVGGSVGGALAPALTGGIVDLTGSFTPALMLAAAIGVLSAAIYGFGIRRSG